MPASPSTSQVTDLHRHFVDQLTIPSRQGKGVLRRVEDVFDCWFESGAWRPDCGVSPPLLGHCLVLCNDGIAMALIQAPYYCYSRVCIYLCRSVYLLVCSQLLSQLTYPHVLACVCVCPQAPCHMHSSTTPLRTRSALSEASLQTLWRRGWTRLDVLPGCLVEPRVTAAACMAVLNLPRMGIDDSFLGLLTDLSC